MKLAIIRQRYDPHGGAERFVAQAASALEAGDLQVTILAREWAGNSSSGRWVKCDPFYIGRIWRDRSFGKAACRAAGSGEFDLVQSHERIDCCDIYRAGDGVHAKWLAYRAEACGPMGKLWLKLSPFHRHLLSAERQLFASTRLRAVICNSRMVRNEIATQFPSVGDRLHVIYNGVDLDRFHPDRSRQHRQSGRARLGIAPDAKTLLFVGSGFDRKGLRVLLEGLAHLGRDGPQLVVVGRDRHVGRYQALAAKLGLEGKVHWVGPQDDVAPWYGLADAFVLPTLYDPFPNATLEALASGLPVVTTHRSGSAEIIVDGVNGFVCRDCLDSMELASNLQKVMQLGDEAHRNARSSAEKLGLPQMAEALLQLYRSML